MRAKVVNSTVFLFGFAILATSLVFVLAPAAPGDPTMPASPPESFRQVLTDVETNVRVADWEIDDSKLDLETPHRWRVHKRVLHGGKQEGVEVIDVDNGVLSFEIVPTRGMGLWEGRCAGLDLGWDSPVDEIVHPALVNLESRGGLGWLEGFGEWINRCGLASNGSPGLDEVTSNTGAIVPVQLTLHGKAAYIPARYVEVVIEPPPSRRIVVRGIVDETMMFGPRLRLTTEISTGIGSKSLTIEDEIRNLAATPQEIEILYHSNFSRPFLEDGARFVAPVRRVFPRDERAAEGAMKGWNIYAAPDPSYIEQVYFLELFGGPDARTEVMLQNRAGDRGVSLAFSLDRLPFLTLWKNTTAQENGYVTGIEPGTNYPNHRKIERAHGRVPKLGGKESYTTELTVTVLTDAGAVNDASGRIASLQKAGAPRVDTRPEPAE